MSRGGYRPHGGRQRKPTAAKIVEGTFRQDRHGSEVQVQAKWPEPPTHLSERERQLWNALEGSCGKWVTPADAVTLNGAVSLMDRILTIKAAQRRRAFDPDDPLLSLELKFWTGLRGFISLLGLSPVDRARVAQPAPDEPPASPLDRFINKAPRG